MDTEDTMTDLKRTPYVLIPATILIDIGVALFSIPVRITKMVETWIAMRNVPSTVEVYEAQHGTD
jgi:hypothetical protein